MIIGLAGKSCSGKNVMGRLLEEKGGVHLDLDRMNHQLLDRFSAEISEIFQTELTDGEGNIDRTALSELVFSRPDKLGKLEAFIHPKIEEETDKIIGENPDGIVILNGAALHKSRLVERMDGLIWMHSPWIFRLCRALRRDNRSLGNILKRFNAQRQFNAQQFPAHVDIYKVYNGVSFRLLKKRTEKMYRRWIVKGETL